MIPCPSLQQLDDLLDQRLNEAECQAISAHVSRCRVCQAQLERLTAATVAAGCRAQRGSAPAPPDPSSAFLARLKHHPPSSGRTVSPDQEGKDSTQRSPGATGLVSATPVPPVIEGYEILDEVGRGGMGVVYRARQMGLNRLVALKMILAGKHAGPKDLARFRQEAEAAARLRHPNIVQIYDVGESGGNPYFALELMEDGSLVQRLRGDPQPLLPAVRLIETVARAIHFAHQLGVIHRDLKPANILLQARSSERGAGNSEEPPVPKITDFGLAKRLDEQSSKTQSGEIVGTPCYMAPEQAAGKKDRVGAATDVYALGAILYELFTGRPPFKGATALDTVLQVVHEEPVRPRYLRPDLPRDLETICLKCLTKEPGRRYATADALADDLYRFRKGKPILARPVSLPERAWKWAKQRPVPAALLLGILLVSWLGFAGVTWQWREANLARDAALAEEEEKELQRLEAEIARADAVEAQRQEADQRKRARAALYYSRIVQSQLHWRVNDFPGALHSLARCRPRDGQEDRRGWEWFYLHGLFQSDLFTLRQREIGLAGGAVFGAQGKRIVSVVGGHLQEESDKSSEVCIWDAATGEVVRALAGPGTWHRVAVQDDGQRLALAGTDGRVVMIDVATGRQVFQRDQHAGAITGLAFRPDGRQVASAGWDGVVRIWSSATGEVLHELKEHKDRVQSLSFNRDGSRLATGSWDTTIKIWEAHSGRLLKTLAGHKSAVYCVAFSPDGQFLASAGANGNLKIWEMATGRVVQSVTGHSGAVLSIAYSPDGRYVAYGSGDATVRIWDIESGVERVTYRGHIGPVESVDFSPGGRRLVSSSPSQAEVKVWDLTRHPEYATFARTVKDVEAMAFADDGRRLLSVTMGGKLQTWDAKTGVLLRERGLDMPDAVISPAVPASFSPGGLYLAARSRGDRRRVKVWDSQTCEEVVALVGHPLPVVCVRFFGDGRQLVTCACDPVSPDNPHEIRIWDAATGESILTRTGTGHLFSVAVSPDGRWLIWGEQKGVVSLADLEKGARLTQHFVHSGDVTAIAFSPDGSLLATGGFEDRTVKLWKRRSEEPEQEPSWQPILTFPAPSLLCDLVFSPDNSRLVGISRDVVKMWVAETGQEVLTLRGAPQRHFDPAFNPRVIFSPDGHRLVGTNWDESISIWDAEPETEEESLPQRQAQRSQAADARAHFWHLEEAEHCLEHRNPAAARFHLERLKGVVLPGPLHERRNRLEYESIRVTK
jgi:WD40 repeat protein